MFLGYTIKDVCERETERDKGREGVRIGGMLMAQVIGPLLIVFNLFQSNSYLPHLKFVV